MTDYKIVENGIYTYISTIPSGCLGHKYKVHRLVTDVPSYQQKVLVEALAGHDKGLWFVCSLQNFSVRYNFLETSLDFLESETPKCQQLIER